MISHKFKAKAVNDDGHRFPSTLEWKYFKYLELLQKSGEVLFFLRQVPFHLPGGVKYVVDFQVFNSDCTVDFVDVKGMATETFKIKVKIVEDLYPVKIKIVEKGDF
jgi:hypothetical protein